MSLRIGCGVSVLTLTAISVDRLLALLLGLRYRQVVTLKRTYMMVITFWVMCTVFQPQNFESSDNLMVRYHSDMSIPRNLDLHQVQCEGHVQQLNQTNQLNIVRYKKAVSTAIWLQLAMVASYLPYGVVTVLVSNNGQISSVYYAWCYAFTLVFFNLSLNPAER